MKGVWHRDKIHSLEWNLVKLLQIFIKRDRIPSSQDHYQNKKNMTKN